MFQRCFKLNDDILRISTTVRRGKNRNKDWEIFRILRYNLLASKIFSIVSHIHSKKRDSENYLMST